MMQKEKGSLAGAQGYHWFPLGAIILGWQPFIQSRGKWSIVALILQ